MCGENGQVIGHEASGDMIPRINQTLQLNSVTDQVKIEHAIVAEAKSTRGNITSTAMVSPEDLPECDFLELDCKRAEDSILENIRIDPRVISVETHEPFGVSHEGVLEQLERMGYTIVADTAQRNRGLRHITATREHQ